MVLIDAVAGCEAYNLRYFVQSGGAVTADSPEKLCEMCLKLMRDEKRRTRMMAALASLPHQNAAQCICNTMHLGSLIVEAAFDMIGAIFGNREKKAAEVEADVDN